MGRVDWLLGQVLFWILVVAIVVAGVVGIRRSGAVLAAHQAGIVGGRAARGLERGLVQAGDDLGAWWGVDPWEADRVVKLMEDPARRSILVRVRGALGTLFGGSADLGAGSFQRREEFYPGPPADFE